MVVETMSCNDNGFDNLTQQHYIHCYCHYECVLVCTYCSLNSIAVQTKNCTFRTALQLSLKNITNTSDNNGI